jgi:hypothetical protein
MAEKSEYEVTIFEGKRSWYELVLAAVFFGVFVYLLLQTLYAPFVIHSLKYFLMNLRLTVGIGLYCLAMGLRFSTTKNTLIDIDTNRIVTRYVVGLFSYGITSKVNNFDYISFFKDRNDCFSTNLWCVGNRHYKMYTFETKEAAFEFSLDVAKKLKIDLLDSTERGNHKWIEKEKL